MQSGKYLQCNKPGVALGYADLGSSRFRSHFGSIIASMSKRKAVDVSPDVLLPALNLLPFATIGSKVGWYVNKKFKRAPSWAKAAKAVPCLSCIADASMGRAVKHVSMRQGVIAWSTQNDLLLKEDQIDDLAYSLRAITAQLMNMKSQSRQIPRQWAAKFETFYAKLDVQQEETPQTKTAVEAIEDRDDDESDDYEMITNGKPPVDLVSISDDSDNDTFDASKLFDSDDPVLRAILQKDEVCRKIHRKSPQGLFPVGPLDVTRDEMPRPAAENVRNDEPTAKKEHGTLTGSSSLHNRQGVALGDEPRLDLQHKDDDKMGKQTGSIGTKTHAKALHTGNLGDLSWINDDMPAKKSTSMSSSGNDNLTGDAKKNGHKLKVQGTSSCPAESEPSALSGLQLLAKGIRTGCALSPSEWAAVSKAKKEEAKNGMKKTKAQKAAMKKRKAAARRQAMTKKSKKVVPKSKDSCKTAASAAAASAVSEPAATAPSFATPTASASATAFAKFIHQEYSKKYHKIKTELMRGGFSKDDAAARGADAARQHVADLRRKREKELQS